MKKLLSIILLFFSFHCFGMSSKYDDEVKKAIESKNIPTNTILFLNFDAMYDDRIVEMKELHNEQKRLMSEGGQPYFDICKKIENLELQFKFIGQKIAKSKQALMLMPLDQNTHFCPDNAQDINITQYVVNIMNAGYTPAEEVIKTPNERLFEAIQESNLDKARKALKNGADVNLNKNGKSLIFWAITYSNGQPNSSEISMLLMDNGAPVNESLIQPALSKRLTKLAIKIAEKCNIDFLSAKYTSGSEQKFSILELVAMHNDMESLLYLLRKGVACSGHRIFQIGGGYNRSLMDIAILCSEFDVTQNSLAVIQELINRGYKVDDIWENSVFIYRAPAALKLFLSNGAKKYDCKFTTENGSILTPLLRAIIMQPSGSESRKVAVVKALIDEGASVSKKGRINGFIHLCCSTVKSGEYSPFSLALELGEPSIIKLLSENGATE